MNLLLLRCFLARISEQLRCGSPRTLRPRALKSRFEQLEERVLLTGFDFSGQVAPEYAVGRGAWSVVGADVDGDGAMDLATANFHSNTVSVLRNLRDEIRRLRAPSETCSKRRRSTRPSRRQTAGLSRLRAVPHPGVGIRQCGGFRDHGRPPRLPGGQGRHGIDNRPKRCMPTNSAGRLAMRSRR